MSTDTTRATAQSIRADRLTTAQLLAAAARDSDPASVFAVSSEDERPDRAIIVVKGAESIAYLIAMMQRQGLLTAGKPVEGGAT